MNQLDRTTILKMVAEGKITPEEASQLLEALGDAQPPKPATPSPPPPAPRPPALAGKGKFLRVIVQGKDDKNDKIDVDVNVPIKLARKLSPMLDKMIPPDAQAKMDESGVSMAMLIGILESLDEDMEGRDLVNVTMKDAEDGLKVRVYVE